MSFLGALLGGFKKFSVGGTVITAPSGQPAPTTANFVSGVSGVYNASTGNVDLTVTATAAAGQTTTTVANGLNSNIPTNGQPSIRLSGPTGAFSVGGFSNGGSWSAGQTLEVINTTAWPMTIVSGDTSSTPANRITVGAGVTLIGIAGYSKILLTYDGVTSRLVLKTSGISYPTGLNLKDFGAVGDGITDDTQAILNWRDAIQGLNPAFVAGGKGIVPMGTYLYKKTINWAGDYGHHYEFEGIAGGFGTESTTRFLWGGPAGVTPWNAAGMNLMKARGICWDAGAGSILYGRYVTPSVPIIGGQCAAWFHTNQYNMLSFSGIAGAAATLNNTFDHCAFTGTLGGMYANLELGDGSNACVTWDGTSYTIYTVTGCPNATVGDNNVDTAASTTLTSQVNPGDTTIHVTSAAAASLTKRRAIILSAPGQTPWAAIISNISANTITVYDPSSTAASPVGCPAINTFPVATTAVYNCYPAATYIAPPSGTGVAMPTQIINSEVQGFRFRTCNFYGGGWDTTSANPNQHTYCNVRVNSGSNTEVFDWTDNCVFNDACYHTYSPISANNEWVHESTQFGTFSAACVRLFGVAAPLLRMVNAATESAACFGYFCQVTGSSGAEAGVLIDSCEMVFCAVGNPYGCGVKFDGPVQAEMKRNTMLSCYDLGSAAQPMAISAASGGFGAGALAGTSLIFEHNRVWGEQYQISVFNSTGNDILGAGRGGTNSGNAGTNFTHAWDPSATYQFAVYNPGIDIRTFGNLGTNLSSQWIKLPSITYQPEQLQTGGMITVVNQGANPGTEVARGLLLDGWNIYEVDCGSMVSGQANVLGQFQSKTISQIARVECIQTFSGTGGFAGLTVDLGTTTTPTGILNAAAVPATSVTPPYIDCTVPTSVDHDTWGSAGTVDLQLVPHFAGSLASGTGKLRVYFKAAIVSNGV